MKIFKNKFFVIILIIIFTIFSLQFYFISNSYKRDTNSYVILVNGNGSITSLGEEKKLLKLNEKRLVKNGDIITTIGKDSLVVIEWGDKSITRVGGNSKIIIKEAFVSDDLSIIKINTELLKGKTWSNIITIMGKDSYFKQDLKNVTASVRGTVFEANYDNEYIITHKHEILVTNNSGEEKNLYPGQVFSIKNFSLEKLHIIIDENFQKLNEKLDKEYIDKLRQDFINSLNNSNPLNLVSYFNNNQKVIDMLISGENQEKIKSYISKLPKEKKDDILKKIQTLNQILNFENGENKYLYNLKINTRQIILDNSTDEEYNKTLVRYTMYDLVDIFSFSKFNDEVLKNTLSFLYKNNYYIDIKKENLSLENLKNKLLELDKSGQDLIHKGLNKILEFYSK